VGIHAWLLPSPAAGSTCSPALPSGVLLIRVNNRWSTPQTHLVSIVEASHFSGMHRWLSSLFFGSFDTIDKVTLIVEVEKLLFHVICKAILHKIMSLAERYINDVLQDLFNGMYLFRIFVRSRRIGERLEIKQILTPSYIWYSWCSWSQGPSHFCTSSYPASQPIPLLIVAFPEPSLSPLSSLSHLGDKDCWKTLSHLRMGWKP